MAETNKKATKAKAPLYINGRYVVEKQLPAKPAKGAKPYADTKKSVKVTLVKSTAGCLKDQQATVAALGLTKIRSSNVLPDNDATRGMIFKVKHLVVVEEVK
ncbi:MAG: 50S ribosomal protein L30 [Clostridia bacterium]|nr:50S ribosomal protein L30 [Clostridia bacterium]